MGLAREQKKGMENGMEQHNNQNLYNLRLCVNCYIGMICWTLPITLELRYKCREYRAPHSEVYICSSKDYVSSILAEQKSADNTDDSKVNSTPLGKYCLRKLNFDLPDFGIVGMLQW